ncbi:hypothetical protein ACLOJK_012351 [Asimina triloba]
MRLLETREYWRRDVNNRRASRTVIYLTPEHCRQGLVLLSAASCVWIMASPCRSRTTMPPLLLLLFVAAEFVCSVRGVTDPQDVPNIIPIKFGAAVLHSLKNGWTDTPPSWGNSTDPCGSGWQGVACDNNARVTELRLSSMGLQGTLSDDIGLLTQLGTLDLILLGCSFSGPIPDELGNLAQLSYLDLNSNNLNGSIPTSLGRLSNLYWLDLAGNQLTGSLPVSTPSTPGLDLLLHAKHLQLQKNYLSGPVPDLTAMNALNYVDLSNNSFDASVIPEWFTSIPSLTNIIMECGKLEGPIPKSLFAMPQLQEVKLRNNSLNGTLDIANYANQLQLIDLKNNQISALTVSTQYPNSLELLGNPVCEQQPNLKFCQTPKQSGIPYSTSLASCGGKTCPADQKLSPGNCECADPYEGTLTFRAPSFGDLSNSTMFQALELRLWTALALGPNSVELQLFPSSGKYFNRTTVQKIGLELASQTFKPPLEFGPYYFVALPYTLPPGRRMCKGRELDDDQAILALILGGDWRPRVVNGSQEDLPLPLPASTLIFIKYM